MSNPDHMKDPALTRLEGQEWQLVPKHLTLEMTDAYAHAGDDVFYSSREAKRRWAAMLDAAPSAPAALSGSYTSLLEENKRMREALAALLPENCGLADDPSGGCRPSFEKCEHARELLK